MFRCELCNQTSQCRKKTNKYVVQQRPKTYINDVLDHKGKPRYDRQGNKLTKTSEGIEIVKEIKVCEKCYG